VRPLVWQQLGRPSNARAGCDRATHTETQCGFRGNHHSPSDPRSTPKPATHSNRHACTDGASGVMMSRSRTIGFRPTRQRTRTRSAAECRLLQEPAGMQHVSSCRCRELLDVAVQALTCGAARFSDIRDGGQPMQLVLACGGGDHRGTSSQSHGQRN
jgi:hypothetical protein